MKTRYVNVYAVSREYGGPEEGGWWYDALEPVKAVRTKRANHARRLAARLERLAERSSTNRFSIKSGNPHDLDSREDLDPNDTHGMTFGVDYCVRVESVSGYAIRQGRPHYE